jgi:GNAT superfamily N-acetyltransferase
MGRLGVDVRSQGAGVGRLLMLFAMQVALEFSQAVGIHALLVDAKNEQVRGYYQSLGFVPTLDDPLCLFLPMATLQKAKLQAASGAGH